VPKPNRGALEQIVDLIKSHNKADARLIGKMIATPQAVWFTAGTPESVRKDVKKTVKMAAAQRAVPVLVAYNIPFRDCAQFSAGGATTVEEYQAWIDGFAAGIGNAKAVVILEPDGLGLSLVQAVPGTSSEAAVRVVPAAEASEASAANERLRCSRRGRCAEGAPNVRSPRWDAQRLARAGDAAHRLVQAAERADGFYPNVSNYRLTEHCSNTGRGSRVRRVRVDPRRGVSALRLVRSVLP
jgi:endoglucanase